MDLRLKYYFFLLLLQERQLVFIPVVQRTHFQSQVKNSPTYHCVTQTKMKLVL